MAYMHCIFIPNRSFAFETFHRVYVGSDPFARLALRIAF